MQEYGLEAFASLLRKRNLPLRSAPLHVSRTRVHGTGHTTWLNPPAHPLYMIARNEFLQSLFEYVPAMIAADDWRVRAAACEAIGAISLATKDVRGSGSSTTTRPWTVEETDGFFLACVADVSVGGG